MSHFGNTKYTSILLRIYIVSGITRELIVMTHRLESRTVNSVAQNHFWVVPVPLCRSVTLCAKTGKRLCLTRFQRFQVQTTASLIALIMIYVEQVAEWIDHLSFSSYSLWGFRFVGDLDRPWQLSFDTEEVISFRARIRIPRIVFSHPHIPCQLLFSLAIARARCVESGFGTPKSYGDSCPIFAFPPGGEH